MIRVLLCIRNNGQCFSLTLCVFLFVSHSAGESGRPCPTHDHRSSSGVSDHPDVPTSCTGLSGEPHPHFNLSITGTVLTPWLSLKINMLCSTVLWGLWSDRMYSWVHHVNARGLVSRWKLHTSTNCCAWSFWCTAPCVLKIPMIISWNCEPELYVFCVSRSRRSSSALQLCQTGGCCRNELPGCQWRGRGEEVLQYQSDTCMDQKVYLSVFSKTGDSSTNFLFTIIGSIIINKITLLKRQNCGMIPLTKIICAATAW